jgi:uncharacterized protein
MLFTTVDRREFGRQLRSVLSPSQAITDPDQLKGRTAEYRGTLEALEMPGRHVLICGLRGVGKSSLALTTAMTLSGAKDRQDLPFVQCEHGSVFGEVIRDLCNKAAGYNPLNVEQTQSLSGGAGLGSILHTEGQSETKSATSFPVPTSLNEAGSFLAHVARTSGKNIFVIDEFDLVSDETSRVKFSQLPKLLADSGVDAKFIFCGTGERANELLSAHPSAFRQFHTVSLDRLKIQPRLDIIDDAGKALGIEIEHNSRIRIAQISDGFPYFIHLICEKLLWAWFDDPEHDKKCTHGRHYDFAIERASETAEAELREPYERVVQKQKLDGEVIVWAMAEGSSLEKNVEGAFKDYRNLSFQAGNEALTREQLNSRLNNFKREAYGQILMSRTRAWYEFTEKRMRGYARLRAARKGIMLKSDHS